MIILLLFKFIVCERLEKFISCTKWYEYA